MSFRLRVLALVALVTVAATSATAWLTLQQASQQITESTSADQATVATIAEALTEYGLQHGTWEGVPGLLQDLYGWTGERIRLETNDGEVIADTDHLQGRAARDTSIPPISIDPRPSLELPADVSDPADIVLREIATYRSGTRLAACLTRAGIDVIMEDGLYGVPRHLPDPEVYQEQEVGACSESQAETQEVITADVWAIIDCAQDDAARSALESRWDEFLRGPGTPDSETPDIVETPGNETAEPDQTDAHLRCLEFAFGQRINHAAPVPLRFFRGATDEPAPVPTLAAGPAIAVASLVAALAVAGSLLLSRRVLRPIRALTTASHRLAQGDLTERVEETGRDELALLARSFNRMADSLQHGEERQRRLVADVAHELRTPLANLRGFLEALQDGVVTPSPELFASLHEEAVLQQRIVDDLQELALAEAGTLVYHRSRVDLGELVETCRTAHQAVADAAGVRLVTSIAEPIPLSADPDRLRQMLGNLVSNALRATAADGEVSLTVARDGAWGVVTVADTGAGIAAEHLPHIFDRFWRADPARGRTTGGSGLGLAIARQIVADHGGRITVTSEPGVGTTFTITLPLAGE